VFSYYRMCSLTISPHTRVTRVCMYVCVCVCMCVYVCVCEFTRACFVISIINQSGCRTQIHGCRTQIYRHTHTAYTKFYGCRTQIYRRAHRVHNFTTRFTGLLAYGCRTQIYRHAHPRTQFYYTFYRSVGEWRRSRASPPGVGAW